MVVPKGLAASCAIACFLLAGCSGNDTADATIEPPADTGPAVMDIQGIVQTTGFQPIAGATVSLRGTAHNQTTGPDGAFQFPGLPVATYIVDVAAPGFEPRTLRADAAASVTLDVQLQRIAAPEPVAVTTKHHGRFQCALEALIVSGACDAAWTSNRTVGQDPIFSSESIFDDPAEVGWKTVVVDLAFDVSNNPGMAGLRVTVQGARDTNELGTYEMYGRFNGSASFSFRLEPGATLPDGAVPVPHNATTFHFEVLPHSHGYHAVCQPPYNDPCFLGVGAGLDIEFEMLVTVFYGAPAPAGWTMLPA